MFTVYEKVSSLPLTQSEVAAVVENNGKWEGQSIEFRMCSFHFYTIEKKDSKYSVQATDGRWVNKSEDHASFGTAYLALEYMDTVLHSMRNALNSAKPVDAKMLDVKTNREFSFEKIRTQLLTEGLWDGYIEWKPGMRSTITFLKDENSGYALVVQYGATYLSGRAIANITDAFALLADFNKRISVMIK